MKILWPCMVVGLSGLMMGCSGPSDTKPYSPPRPALLPAEARYVGGLDDGVWMACQPQADDTVYCKIFESQTGRLQFERWYRYCAQDESTRSLMMDTEGLHQETILRESRRAVYHPSPSDTPDDVRHQNDLIDKYSNLAGVTDDCRKRANAEAKPN